MELAKVKLGAYHHGADEGVTDGDEGAGLLSEGGRDREPEGGDQRRNEHGKEERRERSEMKRVGKRKRKRPRAVFKGRRRRVKKKYNCEYGAWLELHPCDRISRHPRPDL
jgi:hypothetical protein